MNDDIQISTLNEALLLLRKSAAFTLSYLELPLDYPEMQDMIREGGWVLAFDEFDLLGFLSSLALVNTVLRPEIFEESLNELVYVYESEHKGTDDFGLNDYEEGDDDD